MMSGTGSGLYRHNVISLFIAGAISVIVFQHGSITVLNLLGYAPPPYAYTLSKPFGVPQIWSWAFWGGVWGLVFGLAEKKFPEGPMYYAAAFLFGAILPTLVLWFVVFPLKGLPMASGWNIDRMWVQVVHHGFWGLGVGILLKWRA
jgi:hypothetical protein